MTTPRVKVTEADWQQRVMDTARAYGWHRAHFRPAQVRSGRWVTPMSGDVGFPDLVLARRGRLLVVELKSDRGRLSLDQGAWLDQLGPYGRCWRPRDWDAVLAELSRGAGR